MLWIKDKCGIFQRLERRPELDYAEHCVMPERSADRCWSESEYKANPGCSMESHLIKAQAVRYQTRQLRWFLWKQSSLHYSNDDWKEKRIYLINILTIPYPYRTWAWIICGENLRRIKGSWLEQLSRHWPSSTRTKKGRMEPHRGGGKKIESDDTELCNLKWLLESYYRKCWVSSQTIYESRTLRKN